MKLKAIALAAATVAMISSAALAQTDNPTTGSTGTQGSPEPGTILEDNAKMAPFYTDAEMKQMKTGDEFKAAFQSMSAEDQKRLRDECMNVSSPRAAFCESVKAIQ